MKPSDFFIGSREFFGALIPGLVWLVSLALIFLNVSIHRMLIYAANTNWLGALSFIGLALIIGTLLQYRSFNVSRQVHRFFRKAEQSEPTYPIINRFLNSYFIKRFFGEHLAPMTYREPLIEQTEKRLKTVSSEFAQILTGKYFAPTDQIYQRERRVFTACKRSILARSPELGRSLKEKEAEINLIGTLPLPLLFFALGLLLHSPDISELPLKVNGQPWLWSIGIVMLAAIAIIHLLLRFHALRKEEVRMCLETFLLIEYGLADNQKTNKSPDGDME